MGDSESCKAEATVAFLRRQRPGVRAGFMSQQLHTYDPFIRILLYFLIGIFTHIFAQADLFAWIIYFPSPSNMSNSYIFFKVRLQKIPPLGSPRLSLYLTSSGWQGHFSGLPHWFRLMKSSKCPQDSPTDPILAFQGKRAKDHNRRDSN